MEHHVRIVGGPVRVVGPILKEVRDAGIVVDTAQRVEAAEAGNEHDVATTLARSRTVLASSRTVLGRSRKLSVGHGSGPPVR